MRRILGLLLLTGCVSVQGDLPGQSYLDMPYLNSPLGEEMWPDTDPLLREDAFDCTTFVETVLADADVNRLNKIRYKNGQVGFLSRNHFIESDWLKNNADLVQNVSKNYAPVNVRTVVIDKKNWFKVVHGVNYDVPIQSVDVGYITYENAKEVNLKKTMIVLFVADNPKIRDKIGTDLAIVHMGLWLPNGMLRHASSEHGKVIDVDVKQYMKQRQKNKHNLGIVLVDIKNDR